MITKLVTYIKDTKKEMVKVNWPTRSETVRFTAVVIALSIATAVFMGVLDFIFQTILKNIIF